MEMHSYRCLINWRVCVHVCQTQNEIRLLTIWYSSPIVSVELDFINCDCSWHLRIHFNAVSCRINNQTEKTTTEKHYAIWHLSIVATMWKRHATRLSEKRRRRRRWQPTTLFISVICLHSQRAIRIAIHSVYYTHHQVINKFLAAL